MKKPKKNPIMRKTLILSSKYLSTFESVERKQGMNKNQNPELKDKLDHLLRKTGLHDSMEDPRNIGEMIRNLQSTEMDCSSLTTLLEVKPKRKMIIFDRSPDKKNLYAYIEQINKMLAADHE